jgi:hypothetical protein
MSWVTYRVPFLRIWRFAVDLETFTGKGKKNTMSEVVNDRELTWINPHAGVNGLEILIRPLRIIERKTSLIRSHARYTKRISNFRSRFYYRKYEWARVASGGWWWYPPRHGGFGLSWQFASNPEKMETEKLEGWITPRPATTFTSH